MEGKLLHFLGAKLVEKPVVGGWKGGMKEANFKNPQPCGWNSYPVPSRLKPKSLQKVKVSFLPQWQVEFQCFWLLCTNSLGVRAFQHQCL